MQDSVKNTWELMEEALNESEYRFRQFIEQLTDAVFIHDFSGNFIEVNQAACESLGFTRDELLSMTVEDVDPDAKQRQDEKLFWTKLPVTFETRHKRKDGSTFPVEAHLGPIELGKQKVIVNLARNITSS